MQTSREHGPGKPPARSAARKAIRWAPIAIGAVVLLLGASYKRWIPGGELVGDYVDLVKKKIRILGFRREAASVPEGSVVFLGSSSVGAFPFEVCYPGAPWVNRGVAAEDIPQMIDRLDWSLPVQRPAGIVIFAGQNDLRARAWPPEQVVASLGDATDAVRARFPDVPITLVEMVPMRDTPASSGARLRQLNEGMRLLAEARGFAFVRANRPPITDGHDSLRPEMATPDGRHMNLAGYSLFARWIAEEGGPGTEPLRRP